MSKKSIFHLLSILIKGTLTTIMACAIVIFLLCFWIETQLKEVCAAATEKYPGDRVEALMKFVETEEKSYRADIYRANNHTFWALGQLGDKRALPFLKKLVTDGVCDHSTNICQGEIQEAIHKLEIDQFNLPKYLWRDALNN
ncbi:MAG: hypothetical protein RQ760_11840 [Sedimentisphaerales bacterium]|nr:hypothetical protein [Sedimentisphaerales bacterium]